MLDKETPERRLTTLEKVVFYLQIKVDNKPSSDNWLENLIGSVSDDVAFLEALEYGRAFRQSDKPIDLNSLI